MAVEVKNILVYMFAYWLVIIMLHVDPTMEVELYMGNRLLIELIGMPSTRLLLATLITTFPSIQQKKYRREVLAAVTATTRACVHCL